MSAVSTIDYTCPHCHRQLGFVKPICGKTATCRSCGGNFETKHWMVVLSWTTSFVLLSLALSLVLVVAGPLLCWLAGWEWWIGLVAAGALMLPLVKMGGWLGLRAGGIVANKLGLPEL
jgi:hypothetical protein